jgi:hypothetical protein
MRATVQMHVYLSVNCKTPRCNTTIPVKYLGAYVGQTTGQEAIPEFPYECGRCHKTQRYKITDLFVQHLPYAPPLEWKNGWEP